MNTASQILTVRALILRDDKLLVVNAFAGGKPELWVAPGGRLEPGESPQDALIRELAEECGLAVTIGAQALRRDLFGRGLHVVEHSFHAEATGLLSVNDPAGVVISARWHDRSELARLPHKPDCLAAVAWRDSDAPRRMPPEALIFPDQTPE